MKMFVLILMFNSYPVTIPGFTSMETCYQEGLRYETGTSLGYNFGKTYCVEVK